MNEHQLKELFSGLNIPGVGSISVIKFDAPEGYFDSYETYDCECIIEVTSPAGLNTRFFRQKGGHTSYGGTEWYGWKEVKPKEKPVIVYEEV
jgi:hypothetical protein